MPVIETCLCLAATAALLAAVAVAAIVLELGGETLEKFSESVGVPPDDRLPFVLLCLLGASCLCLMSIGFVRKRREDEERRRWQQYQQQGGWPVPSAPPHWAVQHPMLPPQKQPQGYNSNNHNSQGYMPVPPQTGAREQASSNRVVQAAPLTMASPGLKSQQFPMASVVQAVPVAASGHPNSFQASNNTRRSK